MITLAALFSAFSVVSLYFASVWPTGQLGFAAFSSLFVAAAIIEMGIAPGVYVFIVSAALAMLILPDRAAPLLYILFFGYYPVIKNLSERVKRRIIQWVIKLAIFNAALTVIWFFVWELFFSFSAYLPGILILYLGGNAVFILFDYGYSKLLSYYISHISGFTGGRKRPK